MQPATLRRPLAPRATLFAWVVTGGHRYDTSFDSLFGNYSDLTAAVYPRNHAMADYNSWTWSWSQVVGGKYFLESDSDRPASTCKQGVTVRYRPVPQAVTAGLELLDMTQETYNGMWLSLDHIHFCETNNEDSDPVVAWISPWQE